MGLSNEFHKDGWLSGLVRKRKRQYGKKGLFL
jgi:hypothetical protein